MLSIGSIVWGIDDFRTSLNFWCKALDYKPREPLKEPMSPDEDWVVLVPSDSRTRGVQLALDKTSKKAESPNRHHLDLYASDQKREVQRLIGLGAKLAEREYPEDADYVVLEDPNGNPFCVVQIPQNAE